MCLLRGTDWIFKYNSSPRSVESFSVHRTRIRIATMLQAEEPRFESWRGRKFFLLPLPLPPWSHPASCPAGYRGLFPWSSRSRSAILTTYLCLVPWLRNIGALPPQEIQGSCWTAAPGIYPCFAVFWYPSIYALLGDSNEIDCMNLSYISLRNLGILPQERG